MPLSRLDLQPRWSSSIVPHEYGFPGLDKSIRGLAPLETAELHGVVFVTQEEPRLTEAVLDKLPELIAPGQRLFRTTEQEVTVNWKIFVKGFLEGYHIRSTHRETCYPAQFDNLNSSRRSAATAV